MRLQTPAYQINYSVLAGYFSYPVDNAFFGQLPVSQNRNCYAENDHYGKCDQNRRDGEAIRVIAES